MLYKQGFTYDEMAAELGVSYHTISYHITRMCDAGVLVSRNPRSPLRKPRSGFASLRATQKKSEINRDGTKVKSLVSRTIVGDTRWELLKRAKLSRAAERREKNKKFREAREAQRRRNAALLKLSPGIRRQREELIVKLIDEQKMTYQTASDYLFRYHPAPVNKYRVHTIYKNAKHKAAIAEIKARQEAKKRAPVEAPDAMTNKDGTAHDD